MGSVLTKRHLFFFREIKYCSDTIVGMYDTRSVLVHRGIKVYLAKCQYTVTHNCQLRSSIAPHKEHCCQLWEIIMIVVREVVASSRIPECLPFLGSENKCKDPNTICFHISTSVRVFQKNACVAKKK